MTIVWWGWDTQSTQPETIKVEENKGKAKKTDKTVKNEPIEKKPFKIESPTMTEKRRHNRNGILGIDKNNNYGYVPNVTRKFC